MKENPDASSSKISEEVINQQMASALKSHDKILIFLRAVITPNFFEEKEIAKHASTMIEITQANSIMQRHLIGAAETICLEMPKKFPVMIKQLFDEDVLEEMVILEWAEDGRSEYTPECVSEDSRATLRAEAEPVVLWLLEEDSSSDEDSD